MLESARKNFCLTIDLFLINPLRSFQLKVVETDQLILVLVLVHLKFVDPNFLRTFQSFLLFQELLFNRNRFRFTHSIVFLEVLLRRKCYTRLLDCIFESRVTELDLGFRLLWNQPLFLHNFEICFKQSHIKSVSNFRFGFGLVGSLEKRQFSRNGL